MNFQDSLNQSGLQQIMFGKFTEQCAQLVLTAKVKEGIDPSLLAFTWFHESTFNLAPMPQTNHADGNPGRWDYGCLQLNGFWTMRSVFVGEFSSRGLDPVKVFGPLMFSATPIAIPFDGDPLSNLQMGARKLFAHSKVDRAMAATLYTGPDHQPDRHDDWIVKAPLFDSFFANYTPEA